MPSPMKLLSMSLMIAFSSVESLPMSDDNFSRTRILQTSDFAVVVDDLQCNVENNVDYSGNDVGNAQAPTVWDCCGLCNDHPLCWAYTWTNYNDGTCWFKSSRGLTVANSNSKSATLPACQAQAQGMDYAGNDIGSAQASRASDCCAACVNKPGCRAYTFTSYNGGTCWLKSAKGQMVASSGATSGAIYVKASACGLVNGVDYVGNDIGSVGASAPESCCSICQNYSGCRAYSWTNMNGGTCWLKNRKDAIVQKGGVVSGHLPSA